MPWVSTAGETSRDEKPLGCLSPVMLSRAEWARAPAYSLDLHGLHGPRRKVRSLGAGTCPSRV